MSAIGLCPPVSIEADDWLSNEFGHSVWRLRINRPVEDVAQQLPGVLSVRDEVRSHVRSQKRAFYYAKVDTRQIASVRELTESGMSVVDVNVTLAFECNRGSESHQARDDDTYEIRTAAPDDWERLLEIAKSCFRFSRFHLDPLVPDEIANQVKHDWVLSYLLGRRGDRLFVARHDGRAVGFLAALTVHAQGREVGIIDLMGVDQQLRGRGVGTALIRSFINGYAHNCDVLRVGTQIANVPSLRLYQKCGFALESSAYVLHMHVSTCREGKTQNENRVI